MTRPELKLTNSNDQRKKKNLNLYSTSDFDKHQRLQSTDISQPSFYKVHVLLNIVKDEYSNSAIKMGVFHFNGKKWRRQLKNMYKIFLYTLGTECRKVQCSHLIKCVTPGLNCKNEVSWIWSLTSPIPITFCNLPESRSYDYKLQLPRDQKKADKGSSYTSPRTESILKILTIARLE